MTRPITSDYGKELFEARNKIITESNLYSPLHKAVAKIIKVHEISANPATIADLGCGEVSHLQSILESFSNNSIIGVGLDISKEGIIMASKKYGNPIWLVGDLGKSPFSDNSFDVILNILSPANYNEFKRISSRNGFSTKKFTLPLLPHR